jgi:hypothetical protein
VPVPHSSFSLGLAGLGEAWRPRFLAVDRQIDDEAGPLPDLGIGEDEAARLLDDAVDGRQAEAGALADFLGGEEGLEDLAEHVGAQCRSRCR